MINGEGSWETSPEVAPPDVLDELLPWQSQKSDCGDDSPVYSHCSSGGESEFERYCSANSVMGTPSLCSSIGTFQECGEFEFGSFRSSGSGYAGSLENFSLGGGFTGKFGERKLLSSGGSFCLSIDRSESSEGMGNSELRISKPGIAVSHGLNSCSSMESSLKPGFNHGDRADIVLPRVGSESDIPAIVALNTMMDEELYVGDDTGGIVQWRDHSESAVLQSSAAQLSTNVEASKENVSSLGVDDTCSFAKVEVKPHPQVNVEPVDRFSDELHSYSDATFSRKWADTCLDEDKASSRFEHSESEDSMFGYGTDDELKINYIQARDMEYQAEAKVEKEKSLLMSSAVAFGSDDWNDFVQESGESNIILEKRLPLIEVECNPLNSHSQSDIIFSGLGSEQGGVGFNISKSRDQVQSADALACTRSGCLASVGFQDYPLHVQGKDAKDILDSINQAEDVRDKLADYLRTCSGSDALQREQDTLLVKAALKNCLNLMDSDVREGSALVRPQDLDNVDESRDSESLQSEKSSLQLDPLSDITVSQPGSKSNKLPQNQMTDFPADPHSSLSVDEDRVERTVRDSSASFDLLEDHAIVLEAENVELNEFYNEVVQEMEEILLDSAESPGARFNQGNAINQIHVHPPLRDGGSTASTSGNDEAYQLIQGPLAIDGLEVVGAKQKKGDVSFGERLVGVKEYTVYIIRVWSGKDSWEVERRYRDFCTLYRRLKTLFAGQGGILPSPWLSVEKESRKIFGNVSPDVIAERSALIQECLLSILHSKFSSSLTSPLIWFLSPKTVLPSSPSTIARKSQSPFHARGSDADSLLTFGKTISLIVEIRPYKSMKQILEAQHYTCAGCHKHFDGGKTRMLELVQTLGWGKPRLCEYTGQLFCSSCHINETAVLPARVLHYWDFNHYPVSQMAKSYLDSILDQPMLCVSAVNPFLFSKVPALLQVMGVRKRIGAMLPYVRCPFRLSVYKGVASRRYLLESNDFFALRDLIDLSKGAFAALPVMVDTVLRKILEHITEQCLFCCDVGIPCNARQACDDPSCLIFPFQETEVERCRSCKSAFHKACFKRITCCSCGAPLNRRQEGLATLDLLGRKSNTKSTLSFLSRLFTKATEENLGGPKDGDTVILMGSLPSTSL